MKRYALLFMMVLLLSACGRRGALISPEGLAPAMVGDLQVMQRGESLLFSWGIPTKTQKGTKLSSLARFKVMRREVLPPALDCEDCPSAYRLLKEIDLEYLKGASRVGGRLYILDSEIAPTKSYQYRVLALNKDGEQGMPSAPLRGKFLPSLAPPILKAVETETSVLLSFSANKLPEGTVLKGFNIYRSKKGEPLPIQPINPTVISSDTYEERRLERGIAYTYAVGTVIEVNGQLQESILSTPVTASFAVQDK